MSRNSGMIDEEPRDVTRTPSEDQSAAIAANAPSDMPQTPPSWNPTRDRALTIRPQGVAEALARLCPDRSPDMDAPNDRFMSLNDIVTTGLEGGYSWFLVNSYHPDRSGSDQEPWATVAEDDEGVRQFVYDLSASKVRAGLERYIDFRLDRGDSPGQIVSNLEDMDVNDADAVLQMATWGELRYS